MLIHYGYLTLLQAMVSRAQYIYSLAARRRLDLFIARFLEYEEE